jgi:hypothetical protein
MKTVKIRSRHSRRRPNRSVFALVLGVGFAPVTPALADEINVPPGYEVVRLTDDEWLDIKPRINNLGHVVWSKRIVNSYGEEIFLYDGVRIRQITHNELWDGFPDINDHGAMVWARRTKPQLGADGDEIVVYDGTTERIITDNEHMDGDVHINNLGHVVWMEHIPGRCPIYRMMFWDGRGTRILVDDGFSNQGFAINDFDQIAWTRYDDCVNPWKGMIRYWTGREIINITDGTRQDQLATLNNLGLVGYKIGYPDNALGWWAHGKVGVLTTWGTTANLNNRNQWALNRYYEDQGIHQMWIWDTRPIRLTKTGFREGPGFINDCGEVVWSRWERSQWDILLLRLVPGDANHDGKLSIADYIDGFRTGVGGPRARIPFCEGPGADMDRDGDVDLNDFALMQAADVLPEHFERQVACITGPEPPRDVCASLAIDFDRDGDVDLEDFAGFQAVVAK